MGEIVFVVGQSGTLSSTRGMSLSPGFFVVLIAVLVLVWLLSRRIGRWFGRSLKARQDLARSVADVGEKLERIEKKLDAQSKVSTTTAEKE